MRHLKAGRRLSRTTEHRQAMLRNLITALLEQERVETTRAKAKERVSGPRRSLPWLKGVTCMPGA